MRGLLFSAALAAACVLASSSVASAQVAAPASLIAPAPTPTATAAPACPSTFTVEHDDHIGALALAAGSYTLTPTGGISCSQATQKLVRFLQDFDGVLPSGWKVNASSPSFANAAQGTGFSVARAAAPSGTPTSLAGTTCAGTFRVMHNDRIGALPVPAGRYQLTTLKGISCSSASSLFGQFLARTDNKLPAPWSLSAQTGTFSSAKSGSFRIKPIS